MPWTPKGSTTQRSAGWMWEELTGLGVAPPSSRAWNGHLLGLLGLVPRVKVTILVTQSCPTLCDPMDCSPPGSSVHGILQARLLEWVAMSFSRESSWFRDQAWVSCIAGRDSLPSEPLAHQIAPLSDPNFQRGTSTARPHRTHEHPQCKSHTCISEPSGLRDTPVQGLLNTWRICLRIQAVVPWERREGRREVCWSYTAILRRKNTEWKHFRIVCLHPNRNPWGWMAVGLLPRMLEKQVLVENAAKHFGPRHQVPQQHHTRSEGLGYAVKIAETVSLLYLALGMYPAIVPHFSYCRETHSEVGEGYHWLDSLFKEQLIRKQQQAGITGFGAILQLRKLEAAVPESRLSSWMQRSMQQPSIQVNIGSPFGESWSGERRGGTLVEVVYVRYFTPKFHSIVAPLTVARQASLHLEFSRQVWVAISLSRGSSRVRDRTHISCASCIGRRILDD